jgi:hypothetical protein
MRVTGEGRDRLQGSGSARPHVEVTPAGDRRERSDGGTETGAPASGVVSAGDVLRLQRSAGNAAVAHLVAPAQAQAQAQAQAAVGGGPAGAPPAVQRRIAPEDVAGEMAGQSFALRAAFTPPGGRPLPAGTRVTVLTWDNAAETVRVSVALTHPQLPRPFPVPKTLLAPARTAVAGVDPYSAGAEGQAAAVVRGERDLAAWVAQAGEHRSPEAVRRFEAERRRLEDLLARRRQVLNRRLIQETMFNRFDGVIGVEVAEANRAHGLSGRDALDPNLVKSMLFQESQLGTAGQHLEDPPTHPTKTRFNLGQVIDSAGLALLTLFEAEHPRVLADHRLGNLRKDLAAAQSELARLDRKASRTPDEELRREELRQLSRQSWEHFIWAYRAPGAPTGFYEAVMAHFAATTPGRNFNYGFWIHMAVMWLFTKRRAGMSWEDAIRAYNGSGARAEHYRQAVVERAAGARAAAAAGRELTPEGI